jgi:hypothetical protein
MSHTTTIDEVVFSDLDALKQAVKDLNKMGVKCSLVAKAKPRAYFADQAGMGEAEQVLRLENGQYDVGFYYDKAKKGLVAKADFYGNHISGQLGAKTRKGESDGQKHLGKLYHTYAINAATRQAARQGYQVRRVAKPDGSVQLIMTGMQG